MIALYKTDAGYTFKIQAESEEALLNSEAFSTQEEVTSIIDDLINKLFSWAILMIDLLGSRSTSTF